MSTSSKTNISRQKAVRQKVVNPLVSNSGSAVKFPKNSGNSADVKKTTVRRNSDIPVSSYSENTTKCPKKAASSVEKRQNLRSSLSSKTPTRSQSKRTVQPKQNPDQKIDDRSKNIKCSTKTSQHKENETRSHLSQKESGATRKAPPARNNLSKNNTFPVSRPIPVSKEEKLEKCVEARRTVYPQKIELNKSILRRISKSDLNLNIDRLSGGKNANKNFKKVSDSAFESGMKKVSFKYSSANDLNRKRSGNAVKTNEEEKSIFSKLKMPFYEELWDELEDGNCTDDLQCLFEDSFSEGSIPSEQLTVPKKYEQLFISYNNENRTSPLKNIEKITTHSKRNMINFDPAVDVKDSILTDAHKTRIPFYFEDAMQFTKSRITVLSPRNKKENGVQLKAFSKNISDNDQVSFLDPFASLTNKDPHNCSEASEGPLIDFEKATDEYFGDCIAHQNQNIDENTPGQNKNSEDYISEQKKTLQDCIFGQIGNNKNSFMAQCLVQEEKGKKSQLIAGFSCIPVKSNNESLHSTEFISSDPISGDNSSPKGAEIACSLKELSQRDLIEKSIEEKIRILKKQFLKQIKTENKNYYIFQKKMEYPKESSNSFVRDPILCDSNSLRESKSTAIPNSTNERSETYFLNQRSTLNSSGPVHCYEIKKNKSSLSNLLLEYYDQHIKSPSTLSETPHLQRNNLIPSFTITSPGSLKVTEGFENFTQSREELKNAAPISSTNEEFFKSIASEDLEHNSENFNAVFNELDSVRKFDDFFGKAVIDEETLKDILETYFLDEENNCLNQLKPSEEEETRTRNSQISSHGKTDSTASYMFKTIPLTLTIFLLFTSIVRYFLIDNERIDL